MFTGIIEHKAQVIANHNNDQCHRLILTSPIDDPKAGESISINGVCLTCLPSDTTTQLHFDVSSETLKLTTLGGLKQGDTVNMERAMNAAARFGGHYVSGHVDRTARVHSVVSQGAYIELIVTGFDHETMLYLLPKGSISVDGVSLTINAVQDKSVSLMLIPHTLSETTLSRLAKGDCVNIEFDYIAKMIAHQVRMLQAVEETRES